MRCGSEKKIFVDQKRKERKKEKNIRNNSKWDYSNKKKQMWKVLLVSKLRHISNGCQIRGIRLSFPRDVDHIEAKNRKLASKYERRTHFIISQWINQTLIDRAVFMVALAKTNFQRTQPNAIYKWSKSVKCQPNRVL